MVKVTHPVRLLVFTDPSYHDHAPGNWPEGPHRLDAIHSALAASGLAEALVYRSPSAATPDDLALVHSHRHIDRVKRVAAAGGGYLTLDTVVSAASYDVALMAAGGAMGAVDAVLNGEAQRACALVRPPGHHATAGEGMGFCLFNNVAVAARHCITHHGLSRIMIIDWDLHHGNGTESIFYDSSEVLFISLHEAPAYPGTGWLSDTGEGEGEGYTVNIPVPAYSGESTYLSAFETIIAPITRAYRPQLMLVSCGLDAHFLDPIGHLSLSSSGYGRLTEWVCALAEELCGGRVVFVLEGGYDPIGLGWSMASVLSVASEQGGPLPEPEGSCRSEVPDEPSGARERLSVVRKCQMRYWPLDGP